MYASEHSVQREETLHVLKADNMQLARFASTEGQTEKWALIFTFAYDGSTREWRKFGEDVMDCVVGLVKL